MIQFIILFIIYSTNAHHCIHHEIKHKTPIQTLPTLNTNDNLKQNNNQTNDWKPMKVKLDFSALYGNVSVKYPYCTSVGQTIKIETQTYKCKKEDIFTEEKKKVLIRLAEQIKMKIEKLFQVHSVGTGKQILGSCGNRIFEKYDVEDDVDFVLFVNSYPHVVDNVLAYASSCAKANDPVKGDKYYRYVAGYINVITSQISTEENEFVHQLSIVLHETLHTLGFDDCDQSTCGNLGIIRTKVIDGKPKYFINEEPLLKVARKHYKCDSIQEVPMENGGGEGTKKVHWERTWVMNEMMNGHSAPNPPLSELTLAFFESLGVYKPNYEYADALAWGRNEGCDFLKKCSSWPKMNGYNCNSGIRRCTRDRTAIGMCNKVRFKEDLPKEYQHYNHSKIGGTDELAEYCVYVEPLIGNECYKKPKFSADYIFNTEMFDHGQQYGDSSYCFESTLINMFPIGIRNHYCYAVQCLNNSYYKVNIHGKYYECNHRLQPSGYSGYLQCANAQDICGNEVITDWPEVDRIDNSEVSIGDTLILRGRNLHNVTKVYLGDTPLKITRKTEHILHVEVDYWDPYTTLTYVYPPLTIEVNKTVNSCYEKMIKLETPFGYFWFNLGNWLFMYPVYAVAFPVYIVAVILFIVYVVLFNLHVRQKKEIDEKKTIIAGRLKDPMKKRNALLTNCCKKKMDDKSKLKQNHQYNTLQFEDE